MAAQDQDPWTLAKDVLPLLSYSAPFAIYHQYLQVCAIHKKKAFQYVLVIRTKSHGDEHFTASGDMYAQPSAREDGYQSANNRTLATRISGATIKNSPSHADELFWRLCS